MSNLADFYCPDETVIEGDPTNEEMMTEREFLGDLQKRVGELQFLASCLFQEIGMRLDTFCPPREDAFYCPVIDPFAQ
jgi:hypothetical protein